MTDYAALENLQNLLSLKRLSHTRRCNIKVHSAFSDAIEGASPEQNKWKTAHEILFLGLVASSYRDRLEALRKPSESLLEALERIISNGLELAEIESTDMEEPKAA